MSDVTTSQAQDQLPDWTIVEGRLEISVLAKDFVQAIEFVNRFTNIADAQDHHPDFDIRYNTIRMRVVSHDVGGLTERDINFATAVNVLIEEMGLKRQPEKIARTQLVLVTPNVAAIKPFWQAVYNFKAVENDENLLVDRSDVLPPIRFQELADNLAATTDGATSPSNVHLEVMFPAPLAADRLRAVIDAGGKLLSEAKAPYYWELADQDGNRVVLKADR